MTAIPPLPDEPRETSYNIVASTGPLNVDFDIYSDGSDYGSWLEVYDDDVLLTPVVDYTVTSPSGSLATLARPITDAQVTFTTARTGAIDIYGLASPRRISQVAENRGVPAHDFNLAMNHTMSLIRELYDRVNRGFPGIPGPAGPTGSVSTLADGSLASPALRYTLEPTSGFYRAGAGDHRFGILGVTRLTMTATGLTYAGTGNFTRVNASGAIDVGGNLVLSADSPASLSTNQNNYAVASPQKVVNRLTSSANVQITGMVATSEVIYRIIFNSNAIGGNTITLVNESASSTAANRFNLAGNATVVIEPGEAIGLVYDVTAQRWIMVSSSVVTDFALAADVATGTSIDKAVTPSALTGEQIFGYLPQNSKSAAYTLVATDRSKHIFHPSADTTARTWTIPANATVAFPIGTTVTFINQNGAGAITIAITSDTLRKAGDGATGSRTLAANGIATAVKVTATEWIISGEGLT